jgi:peroxiredoxin
LFQTKVLKKQLSEIILKLFNMKFFSIVFIIGFLGLTNSQLKAQFAPTALDICPLLIGEPIPDVIITDSKGMSESLVTLTKEKPTVIFFYRGNWCSNCIIHFSQEIAPIVPEITKLGYNLIAISPDVPDTLIITSKKTGLDQAVFYSDGDGKLSTAMGVAFQQGEKSLSRLLAYSGGKNKGFLPVPSAFVVNTENKIIFEYINPNGPQHQLRIRGKFLLAVLQALK